MGALSGTTKSFGLSLVHISHLSLRGLFSHVHSHTHTTSFFSTGGLLAGAMGSLAGAMPLPPGKLGFWSWEGIPRAVLRSPWSLPSVITWFPIALLLLFPFNASLECIWS